MLYTGTLKRKVGRPKTPEHLRRTVINISISGDLLARLDRAVYRANIRTRQVFMRELLEKELKGWESTLSK
jgi:metal-responsive CopG/Arc/MetJ family transcriptional regulator